MPGCHERWIEPSRTVLCPVVWQVELVHVLALLDHGSVHLHPTPAVCWQMPPHELVFHVEPEDVSEVIHSEYRWLLLKILDLDTCRPALLPARPEA